MNGNVSLFLLCLLVVYRKTTGFPKLILHPATWLIVSTCLAKYLAKYLCTIFDPLQGGIFGFFFLIYTPSTSFPCLFAPASASRPVLERRRDSGQSCLVSDYNEIAFYSSQFRTMLAVALTYIVFIIWRYVLSSPALARTFVMKVWWVLSKVFFYIY